nr:GNAT family N-acetyltransferase [uncultured Mucilaginibacter sp.]
MQTIIETSRLIIREITSNDLKGMFEIDSDAEVHRYLGNDLVKSIGESEKIIAFIRQQYLDNGIGRWAMTEKESGNFMGWTGFKFISETINGQSGYYDLGYRMLPRYWGKGYATEGATACLKYGLEILNLKPIYAMANAENAASKNVLIKTGFTHAGTFMHHNILHHWFVLSG